MANSYTRHHPSPRYRELLAQYQDLHLHGERRLNLPPEATYNGASLPRHAARIRALIQQHEATTILDYGSGKGHQYQPMEIRLADGSCFKSIPDYWGANVTCYDPAYPPYQHLPHGCFDGVVCTDVLEHVAEADLPWILDELFGFARKFVFANVACYQAVKHLPNGENAHCTVRPASWWQAVIRQARDKHPGVRFDFCLDEMTATAEGKRGIRPVTIAG